MPIHVQTYDEAAAYINETPKFTTKTSLAHTRRLLALLGHPEEGQKILHVAGTNGKGSVCAALDAMLRSGGRTVGLFTSPHLVCINERFQINGKQVSDPDFLSAFLRVMKAAEQLMAEGGEHPTFFETLFLMAMVLFHDAGVEYTVLEVGMGGRLDATNAVRHPLITVITSISLDHTQYLGETIPEIAAEKAGIIKPGIPVVCDAGQDEISDVGRVSTVCGKDRAADTGQQDAVSVIRSHAEEAGSPFFPLRRNRSSVKRVSEKGTEFCFREDDGSTQLLRIPQIAPYQVVNAALAWYTLRILQNKTGLTTDAMREGLARMRWPGRMQEAEPGVWIDGAHNPDGIHAFINAVRTIRNGRPVTLLFGALQDKHYSDMIRELAEGIRPEQVVTTRISSSRAVSEEELARLFLENGCPAVFQEPVPAKALEIAAALRGSGPLFCVGSLYLAGEILGHIQK